METEKPASGSDETIRQDCSPAIPHASEIFEDLQKSRKASQRVKRVE
jgi:hypothetical protein